MHVPLSLKIPAWFLLNLLLVAAGGVLFFKLQLRVGLDTLLSGRAGERIEAFSGKVAEELSLGEETPDAVLQRLGEKRGVGLSLFQSDGRQEAGVPVELPDIVREAIVSLRPPEIRRISQVGDLSSEEEIPRALFIKREGDPKFYWMGVEIFYREKGQDQTGILLVQGSSISSGKLLVETTKWVLVGLGVAFFCILFWLPLVRGITGDIRRLTGMTESLAAGNLVTGLTVDRNDEIGRLGDAINRMSERISGFVNGQRRFVADIAHELGSPIARANIALEILEHHTAPERQKYVESVREEIESMADMVSELLSFSRASLADSSVELHPVLLEPIVEKIVGKEGAEGVEILIGPQEGLRVLADEELLMRVLANLVRNAVRYAGHAGPVNIKGERLQGGTVTISVSDFGPGIPPGEIERIFDPFYRPEKARTREGGGVGLGLAIVKAGVEACSGEVTCRNLDPRGFETSIKLAAV